MGDKPHVSVTQLDMHARCPELYRQVYRLGNRRPPQIAMLIGSGVHRGAEANFRQKIESREDMPANHIVEAAVAGFEEEASGGYELTHDEESRGAGVVIGEAKDVTAQLAAVHAEQQAPDYQPVAVEHTTRIVFKNATHDLLTITDIRDDKRRVTDFKTGAKKRPQGDADSSVQLTAYAAAYQLDNGRMPSEVRLDVLTKTKTPARQLLSSTRTNADFAALLSRVNAMLRQVDAIDPNEPWAAAPIGSWWCSPRFCGFWRSCPHVNSERKASAEKD